MSGAGMTESEFDETLTTLLQRAHSAGVPVEGAWKCDRDDDENRCWDVEIVAVEYRTE